MTEKLKVKLMGLSFGVRSGRNTAWLVLYALKAAEKFGRRIGELAEIETEFYDLAHKQITQCCGAQLSCLPNKGQPWKGTEDRHDFACVRKNDYFAQLAPRFAEVDGFIFGSPVHQHCYTSKFRLFTERLNPWTGDFTSKPSGLITVAFTNPPFGGQDNALKEMATQIVCIESLVVASGEIISGPPYGPTVAADDGRVIGAKNDEAGKKSAAIVGRRVAEYAVMFKLARRELGKTYDREFFRYLHPPHGEQPWAWNRLEKEEEDYLRSLP